MKNIYMRKLGLLVMLVLSPYSLLFADYVSKKNTTGDFEDEQVWDSGKKTQGVPNANGVVNSKLIIESGAFITRNGDFDPVTVEVNGTLIVKGNYQNNRWSGLIVKKNAKVEVFGDLYAGQGIDVQKDGLLIVHGNLISTGSNVTIHGDIVVVGNFSSSSSTEVKNQGNLIVGGDFTHAGGGFKINGNKNDKKVYILNPDAIVTAPDWSSINDPDYVGDLDDFLTDEPNSELGTIVEDLIISVQLGYQWVGNKGDNTWDSVKNWTGNRVPSKTSDVRIKASNDNPIISLNNGTVEVNNLTIEAGAVLTLNPGAKLTVNGDLTIADKGGVILKNTADVNGLASLMTNGSVNGEVRIELELPRDEWYYVSQPIKEAKSDIYALLDENGEFRTSEAWVNIHRANRWYRIADNVAIAELEGVSIKYRVADVNEKANHTVSYIGELNNGSISRNFKNGQYYLFGNPYSSAINWQDVAGWERNNIGGTIYYRARVNGVMTFVTYNRTVEDESARAAVFPDGVEYGDVTEIANIPPLQSVWISSLGDGSITIDNKARQHVATGSLLKSSSSGGRSSVIRIVASSEGAADGTVLYFSENADEGIDRGDSEKMFNESVKIPEVYTRVGGKAVAINGLPALVDHSYEIPLSVRNRIEGYVDLKFDLSNFSNEYEVLLRDEYEDVEINLREVNQYRYEPFNLGDNHDRFVLRFNPSGYKEDVSTSILDEMASQGSTQINIVGINGRAIVSIGRELLAQGAGKIEVYSIEGLKMSEAEARTNKTFLVLPPQAGVYIVVVSASGERKVKKLLR